MAGMSVSTGLVSGIDYDTMITQLMQVEANPQTLLKQQLSATTAESSDSIAARRAIVKAGPISARGRGATAPRSRWRRPR